MCVLYHSPPQNKNRLEKGNSGLGWTERDSDPRPLHCKCSALPLSYRPKYIKEYQKLRKLQAEGEAVRVEGIGPSASSLSVKRSTSELHARRGRSITTRPFKQIKVPLWILQQNTPFVKGVFCLHTKPTLHSYELFRLAET